MDIIELPTIPRDAGKLKAILGAELATRRKRRLTTWAAINLAGWAVYVLLRGAPPPAPASSAMPRPAYEVYLPIVAGEVRDE